MLQADIDRLQTRTLRFAFLAHPIVGYWQDPFVAVIKQNVHQSNETNWGEQKQAGMAPLSGSCYQLCATDVECGSFYFITLIQDLCKHTLSICQYLHPGTGKALHYFPKEPHALDLTEVKCCYKVQPPRLDMFRSRFCQPQRRL
jgi:hypothetical protein